MLRGHVRLAGALALAVVTVVTGPAVPAGAEGLVRVVETADELRDALAEASASGAGPHRIVLAADIDLGGGATPVYDGDQPLTVQGRGHTVRNPGAGILDHRSSALLTVFDLTLTDAARGLRAEGSVIVRRSRFLRLGTGPPLRDAGGVLTGRGPQTTFVIRDSELIGNRAFALGVIDGRNVELHGSRLIGNTASRGVVRAMVGLRVRDTEILRSRTPADGVLVSEARNVLLDRSVVAGTLVGHGHREPTIDAARGMILMDESIVRDNGFGEGGRAAVAVAAPVLRARYSLIRHGARDCWITQRSFWVASVASDRSCRVP